MKKTAVGIMMIMVSISTACAQKKQDAAQQLNFKSGSVITTFSKEVTEYQFDAFEDLYNGIDEISKEFTFSNSKKSKEPCEVDIAVKIEMEDETSKMSIISSITTLCNWEAISNTTKKLKAFLQAALL